MSTVSLLRKIMSTRYIFVLSGLAFILWSLATTIVPRSSTFAALLQVDLEREFTRMKYDLPMSNSLTVRPDVNIGISHAHIYVISLAERQDRRDQMELLRTIQDLTWTVIDATPRNATVVDYILDRVSLARTLPKDAGFRWPEEIDALSTSAARLKPAGSEAWAEVSSFKPDRSHLACATEDDVIPTFSNDTPEWMVLSPAKIACWHSHVSAIRRFVEGQDTHQHSRDDVVIILEDDIDMEKDISTRLSRVWSFLPPGWDILFLGHCWSDESRYPSLTPFTDTNIHPSHHPKCTHAYALSLSGARRLLQHLRYPPFAYSRALDQALAWLVRSGRLRSYSIVPSLVVQRKKGGSDIASGSGSEWRERLSNGVLQT